MRPLAKLWLECVRATIYMLEQAEFAVEDWVEKWPR